MKKNMNNNLFKMIKIKLIIIEMLLIQINMKKYNKNNKINL